MTQANQKPLTEVEQQKLYILLNEAKARGIDIDKIAPQTQIVNKNPWNVDERGYFIRADGKKYNPTPKQAAFIDSKSPFVRGKAGRGSGKTAMATQKCLRKVKEGKTGTVINPDFENFKISTWPEFKEWIPWDMVVPQHQFRKQLHWEASRPFALAFKNGAKIYFKGLKDPQSARGANVNWLWYDEAGRDETGLGWKIAIGSVRIGESPQRIATYTPRGANHWTYQFFDEQEFPEELYDLLENWQKTNPDIPFIDGYQFSTDENKENLDPLFYATLLASYGSIGYLRTQELEGMEAAEETTLGDRRWFNDHILDVRPDWIVKEIRYWDLAASLPKVKSKRTKTDPDFTVGTLLGCNKSKDEFCIVDQDSGQWKWDKIKENMLRVAMQDGTDVPIYIEVEPGSGGINQVAALAEFLKSYGFVVREHNPKNQGDKVMRANVWFGEAASGHFWLVKGLWTDKFFKILDGFPAAVHDDEVDSVSGARHIIAPIRKWRKAIFTAISRQNIQESSEKVEEVAE